MCFGLGFGFLLTIFVGPAQVRFAEPNLLGGSLQVLDLPAGAGRAPCVRTRNVVKAWEAFVTAPHDSAGESLTFDPGESWNFDFHLSVNETLRAHVVRGGSYSVKRSDSTWSLETLSLPKRQRSERLSNLKGLSFSFSASGWLVIYQLGVAECLQNHGHPPCTPEFLPMFPLAAPSSLSWTAGGVEELP